MFEAPDLVAFRVVHAESDLQVLALHDLSEQVAELVADVRVELETYLSRHPHFGESFSPVPVEPSAPAIVRSMADASRAAGVGPMAAVAGAIAEHVAEGLTAFSSEVIVENGGDVYLCGTRDRSVGLWAGEGGVKGVGLHISAHQLPLAIATSSGMFGHSLSFGRADAVTIVSASGALADAVATSAGNVIHDAADAEKAIELAKNISGVLGVVVSVSGSLAVWGDVRLVPVGIE